LELVYSNAVVMHNECQQQDVKPANWANLCCILALRRRTHRSV